MADIDTGADVEISQKDREMMHNFGPEIKKRPNSSHFVDGLLSDIRAHNQTGRETYKLTNKEQVDEYAHDLMKRTHIPTYMTDFFSESVNDGIDNKIRRPEFEKLKSFRETAAEIAAGIKVTDEQLHEIRSFIDTVTTYWENKAENSEPGDERQTARENQGVFRAFQMVLENPVVLEDIDNGTEASSDTVEAEVHPQQEDLPRFEFVPTDFLEKQESEDVNFNDLYDYLADTRKSLYAQERKFKKDNPQLSNAVRSGWEYHDKHKEATEDIMVIIDNGQVIFSGGISDAPSEQKRQGKDTFTFKADSLVNIHNGIGENARRLNTYETRIDDLDRGLGVVKTLMESDKAVLTGREGDKDKIAILRIISLHRNYLANKDSDPTIEKQWNILAKFSELVNARVSTGTNGKTEKRSQGKKSEK